MQYLLLVPAELFASVPEREREREREYHVEFTDVLGADVG